MENIVIKNRVDIVDKNKKNIHNIKANTKDSISKAEFDLIDFVIKETSPGLKYNIRYKPDKKGSFEITSVIDFLSDANNKDLIYFIGIVLSGILLGYGNLQDVLRKKTDRLISNEKLKQEIEKTKLIEKICNSYSTNKYINDKYRAMSNDEEVVCNKSTITYGNEIDVLEETKDIISSRVRSL